MCRGFGIVRRDGRPCRTPARRCAGCLDALRRVAARRRLGRLAPGDGRHDLATPLYSVYAKHFHFSSLVLTAIFATYAFVLVPALIASGRLSDQFGRRPVLFAGLVTASAG